MTTSELEKYCLVHREIAQATIHAAKGGAHAEHLAMISVGHSIIGVLYEVAYQLAVMNERNADLDARQIQVQL